MEYAIITNGVVTNVIVGDANTPNLYPGAVRIDTFTPVPGIGWTYNGTTFTPPAAPAYLTQP